ncbi:alanine--tRNA ligase [Candidatus Woesearchaeota archaeon]|nr:alanine--tRNA ligase [Candidatus Woesearchaeota archaeon]
MHTDKEIKKEFKITASKNPDAYYATAALKVRGFMRKQCACSTFFWTVNADQKCCGDPACSGGFRFFSKSPAKKKLNYIEVWKEFAAMHKKRGYTPIDRYPVVARWRDDAYFVAAGIYDFQPYVVSGEVEPPANPIVEPQFCLRFNDIDNVGITGAHYTGFSMIGQHAFMPKEKFDTEKYWTDLYTWFHEGLGLSPEELTLHEDAWAGGGNFGPCMEFFSRGLELANQVYMLYEQTPSGSRELHLKVLDMGMGQERNAWFTQGLATSYETTFPTVMKKLYSSTGIKTNQELLRKFLPYSSYLNIDEVEDIEKVWADIAAKTKEDAKTLKEGILPLAALFSVAEHARSLLVALNDGALPSNVGGGYNLRVILRRALGFIEHYGWDIEMADLCEEHARFLKPMYPELLENLENVKKIVGVEKRKYKATREKSQSLIASILKEKITAEKLLELYDSHGIAPELVKTQAAQAGKPVDVPDNFYALVSQMHEKKEQSHQTKREEKIELTGIPETAVLYFDNYLLTESNAKVLRIIDQIVILDRTNAYPTSGGQIHDQGSIDGIPIASVFKQGNVVLHVLSEKPTFSVGSTVTIHIEPEYRKQLAQHHTATHVVGAAARKILGSHINQASAKKTLEKAHLDITHYEGLSDDELQKIEEEANRLVHEDLQVHSHILPRNEAEKRYGMAIYQGGAVPGKTLRIIEIADAATHKTIDVQACGGTHVEHTKEIGNIKLLKSTKISDGVVRIVFAAGAAAESLAGSQEDVLTQCAALLQCTPAQVPGRAQELFENWKTAVKKKKQLERYDLVSTVTFEGDALVKAAEVLKTQPEHLWKTLKRFMDELDNSRQN